MTTAAARISSTEAPPLPAGAERFGAWYDAEAAEAACAFFPSHLVHSEGEWAAKPFVLADWQRERIVKPLFGWKREDGTRLIRVAQIWVPKKNGKTELAAGVGLLCLLGDGEVGGQGYSLAVDKDQAKICFNKAAAMANLKPALRRHLEVFKTSIYCPELMASFKPSASNPETKDGFSPSFLIGDEVHRWVSGELYRIYHESEAARSQPLDFLISTAGIKGRGFGWEMYQTAKAIAEGRIEDPEVLVVIYEAGPDDDWTDEKVWAAANPNLGVSKKLDFLRRQCEQAQRSPRLENDFRRYHLNQWTEQQTRWLPVARWRACSAAPERRSHWQELEKELAGRRCFGGLDLGSTRDVNALVWAFPPADDEHERWKALFRFWVPRETAELRRDRDRVPYLTWARDGAMSVTEGNVTDYRVIKAQIERDAESFDVAELAIDRWNATQVAVELQEEGIQVAFFGQGYASMSAPAKELEKLVLSLALEHGNQPVAAWMAGNVAVATDPAGNIKPDKEKSGDKIDGIVALIMAIGRATAREVARKSVYEQRGLRVA